MRCTSRLPRSIRSITWQLGIFAISRMHKSAGLRKGYWKTMPIGDRSSAPLKSSSGRTPWKDDEILQEVYAMRDAYAANSGVPAGRPGADVSVLEILRHTEDGQRRN